MPDCNRCGIFCKTTKYLVKHQKTAKYCKKYQDIIFVCARCNFYTKGIKNIEAHSQICTGENTIDDPFSEIFNKKNHTEIRKLENKIKNMEMTIINLQLRLKFEQMKNNIYTDIIKSQTDINLENVIQECDDSVHIYNFKNGNIPVVVHNFINQDQKIEKYTINPPNHKTTNKKIKKIQIDESPELIVEDDIKEENLIKPTEIKPTETKPTEKKPTETKPTEKKPTETKPTETKPTEKKPTETKPTEKKPTETKPTETKPTEKKPTETKPTETYRTVKKYIKTSEKELGTKLKEDIVRVDKEINQIVYNNFDVSYKEITDKIESLFNNIENSRTYTTNLSMVKELRKKLLGKLSLEDYTLLVQDHIKRLESIFSERKYSSKKIRNIIYLSLTPLDMRLVYYKGYTNVTIEVDDVQKFALALDILVKHPKQFVPYDKYLFFANIKNYGLALFELQDCIERCLINRYGFNNIMYLSRENKEKSTDPYSFYILDKVGTQRCWKMECRLEDFTVDFIDNVLPYCINLFRKIYKDVFNDNIYREDYMSKSQITEFDCEQLIQNIILMGNPMKLCKIFQKVFITNSTFTLTESDKLNLHGDDKLQQKKFAIGECGNGDDTKDIIKNLFDDISLDNINNIIFNR